MARRDHEDRSGVGVTRALLTLVAGAGVVFGGARLLRAPALAGRLELNTLAPDLSLVIVGLLAAGLMVAMQRHHRRVLAIERAEHDALTAALAEQAERLLVDHAPIGVAVLDADAVIERVNPALCDLLGRHAEQLLGTRVSDLLDAEGRAHLEARLDGFVDGTVSHTTLERQLRAPGGRRVWARLALARLEDPTGALARIIVQVVDLTARHALEEELRTAALQDPLTGIANRRALQDRLSQAQARRRRTGTDIGLIFVDLDRFKDVNDRYGHGVGDRLLREVARVLHARVREVDTVGRLGGDEFVVLLDEVDGTDGLDHVLTRLREVAPPCVFVDGAEVEVGLSIGGTLLDDAEDLDEALRRADVAMYLDKRARARRIGVSPGVEPGPRPRLATGGATTAPPLAPGPRGRTAV